MLSLIKYTIVFAIVFGLLYSFFSVVYGNWDLYAWSSTWGRVWLIIGSIAVTCGILEDPQEDGYHNW